LGQHEKACIANVRQTRLSFWPQSFLGAQGDLAPKIVTAARGLILSSRPEFSAALPFALLAIETQDSGRAGALLPAGAELLFLVAGGIEAFRSMAVPRLFQSHAAAQLSTSHLIKRAEAKAWRQAQGRVLLFCAVVLLLVAFVTMIFAGRWSVVALGATLLSLGTLQLAGFWPPRRSAGGGWPFRAALPAEGPTSALRDHPYPERHVLTWTHSSQLSLLRRAAADAAWAEPELARLLAVRHASDCWFPQVTHRGDGLLVDLHLLWIGGRLVGQVMALPCPACLP